MSSKDNIQPLPPEVVAKLKSSTSITHLNGVILELVKNSLDANAHTIYVTVDFLRGGCVVDDDGDGIPPSEFEESGGLGKAHHTSKFRPEKEVYGHRGLFLASLSALSLLTVASHHVQYQSTNTVIFHHATPVARLIPAPVQHALRSSAHGTTVKVNDLFGNMPVRVKYRAMSLQRPDELDRQWDDLKQLLVSMMIANEKLTKLVLLDAGKDRKIFINPRIVSPRDDCELNSQRIGAILAQTGLVDPQSPGRWDVVSADVPGFSIHAAISLVPSPTKKVQFISMGIDPIYPQNNANFLYNEVNNLFSLSDFGAVPSPSAGTASGESSDHGNVKSVSKAVNKWPMFYIRIDQKRPWRLNSKSADNPESGKSIQRIIDVLSAMINEFLKQNNLRPRATKRKRKATPTQTGARCTNKPTISSHGVENPMLDTEETLGAQLKLPLLRRPTPTISQHFGDWSRVKSANESFNICSKPRTRSTGWGSSLLTPHSSEHGPSTDAGTSDELQALEPRNLQMGHESATDEIISWVDPYTGICHLINGRTGQSINTRSPLDAALSRRPRSTGALQTMRTSDSATRPRSALLNRTQNSWVENLLDKWDNPAFSRTEKPINTIDIELGHEHITNSELKCHDTNGDIGRWEALGLSKFRGKLRKHDLDTAEIIAQVDQKYIFARLQASVHDVDARSSGSVLVLIDQHAADERCRVEELFEDLFTNDGEDSHVQTVTLDPIIFEITQSEATLFRRHKKHFCSWGIEYTVEQGTQDKMAVVFVNSLPTLIAERCRVEQNLVPDLIRGEIWKHEDTGRKTTTDQKGQMLSLPSVGDSTETDGGNSCWVQRLNGCPQGIIELLNSRACRTAIMFNDDLTASQCGSLVRRLARCVFPFQCAHGRPSMIPVLMNEMAGDVPVEDTGDVPERAGFTDAFKSWRNSIAGEQ